MKHATATAVAGTAAFSNRFTAFHPRALLETRSDGDSSGSRDTHFYPQSRSENHFVSLIHDDCKSRNQLYQIHAQILINGLSRSSYPITQLITCSTSLAPTHHTLSLLRHFPQPNTFLFNAAIRGFAENSQFADSISLFSLMLIHNARPNHLTFPFLCKSSASLNAVTFGFSLHPWIVKLGLALDPFVRTSLVDMYVKLGFLDLSHQLFDETPDIIRARYVLLWNVLINGCCRSGDMDTAHRLFDQMPERSVASWNSLICGFLRHGNSDVARQLFDQMPERNVVSWTTMVAGLTQNGQHYGAVTMFDHMLEAGVKPNDLTVVSVLSACARIGALSAGIRVHDYISINGFRLTRAIGTALVDMYAKCGDIQSAQLIFDSTTEKDLLTWSVMISGWAMHGCCEQALQLFERIKSAGIKPDEIVFLALLSACSHSGLVDQGRALFNSMKRDHGIVPTVKHYTCMVDLFGRAGWLDEALALIESMPIEPDFVIWGALFCACRAHKHVKLAELATERLLRLEPKHPGSYIFLSNIYATAQRWEDVERVRLTMKKQHIEKPLGWSFIEVGERVHAFVAGDRSHVRTEEIYAKLEELRMRARAEGHVPDTGWVLHNIEEEEKEDALGSHGEKLALAFGLISTEAGVAIRIVKNLRVCGDCHSMMKFVCKMSKREIILRDIKRFHRFKDGACTCGDYW